MFFFPWFQRIIQNTATIYVCYAGLYDFYYLARPCLKKSSSYFEHYTALFLKKHGKY